MTKFKRTHTDSSLIESPAYDPFNRVLEIVFCKDGIYEHKNISEHEYNNLQNSKSIGLFLTAIPAKGKKSVIKKYGIKL